MLSKNLIKNKYIINKYFSIKVNTQKNLILFDINQILQSNNNLTKKQIDIENILNKIDFLKYYKLENQSLLVLENLKKNLFEYFNKISFGKTFFKIFFTKIDLTTFIDYVLIPFTLEIYFKLYPNSYTILQNSLENFIDLYFINNSINHNFEKEFIQKICIYTIEILKLNRVLIFYMDQFFYIDNFRRKYDINFIIYKLINKWPLIIEPKPYIEGKGAYHVEGISYNIKNKYVNNSELTSKGYTLLNLYQQTKYYLNNNCIVINLIKYSKLKIEEFYIEEIKDNFTYTRIESLINLNYLLTQYLMLVENGIEVIYFPYQLDFRGRIYCVIKYGLNPTYSKLSRVLINTGEYELTSSAKELLKQYIKSVCKCKTEEEFKNKIEYVKRLIENKFENLTKEDILNLESIILIIDWLTNVIPNNKTQILVELETSCQIEFQILSMFSNDILGLQVTNVHNNKEIKDLYSFVFDEVKSKILVNTSFNFKLENLSLITYEMIKKIVMIIPYSGTFYGQNKLLFELLLKILNVENLKDINAISKILKYKLLQSLKLINISEFYLKENNYMFVNSKYFFLLEKDLKFKFLMNVFKFTNLIVNELFPKIIDFIKHIKIIYSKKKSLNEISTEYVKISLTYYKEIEKTNTVRSTKYTYCKIDYENLDMKKGKQSIIANICSLGDAFIIHKIIETCIKEKINIYTIHDAILCKATEVDKLNLIILNSYQYVYDYVYKNKIFSFYEDKEERYKFTSTNIFKV